MVVGCCVVERTFGELDVGGLVSEEDRAHVECAGYALVSRAALALLHHHDAGRRGGLAACMERVAKEGG